MENSTVQPKFKLNKKDFIPFVGLLTYMNNFNKYLNVNIEKKDGWEDYQNRWKATRVLEAFYLTYQVGVSISATFLIRKGLENLF